MREDRNIFFLLLRYTCKSRRRNRISSASTKVSSSLPSTPRVRVPCVCFVHAHHLLLFFLLSRWEMPGSLDKVKRSFFFPPHLFFKIKKKNTSLHPRGMDLRVHAVRLSVCSSLESSLESLNGSFRSFFFFFFYCCCSRMFLGAHAYIKRIYIYSSLNKREPRGMKASFFFFSASILAIHIPSGGDERKKNQKTHPYPSSSRVYLTGSSLSPSPFLHLNEEKGRCVASIKYPVASSSASLLREGIDSFLVCFQPLLLP